jgi:non-hemolytic enterotoxin B/C
MTNTAAVPESLEASIDVQREKVKAQSAAGLILQAHCLSVEAQQAVSFEGFEKLQDCKVRANKALDTAKAHARTYLDTIQPKIITTITSIEEYFLLQRAVGDALASLQSREDAKTSIRLLQERVAEFKNHSVSIRTSLESLRTGLANDQAAFSGLATELNGLLQGDKGVLAEINGQLSSIDGKIAGVAVGIALGGLAVIAGGIMFVVGAFTSLVTGGAAVALCVAGGAVIGVGAAAAAGSSIALGGLLNMKSDLLTRQAKLSAEVTLVNGMMNGFGNLAGSAGQAQESAQSMANAWGFMGDHLESLYGNLDKGKSDNAMLRQIFLAAAEKSVAPILRDVDIIKGQMTAPQRRQDTGQRVGDMVVQEAQKQEEAARRAA